MWCSAFYWLLILWMTLTIQMDIWFMFMDHCMARKKSWTCSLTQHTLLQISKLYCWVWTITGEEDRDTLFKKNSWLWDCWLEHRVGSRTENISSLEREMLDSHFLLPCSFSSLFAWAQAAVLYMLAWFLHISWSGKLNYWWILKWNKGKYYFEGNIGTASSYITHGDGNHDILPCWLST